MFVPVLQPTLDFIPFGFLFCFSLSFSFCSLLLFAFCPTPFPLPIFLPLTLLVRRFSQSVAICLFVMIPRICSNFLSHSLVPACYLSSFSFYLSSASIFFLHFPSHFACFSPISPRITFVLLWLSFYYIFQFSFLRREEGASGTKVLHPNCDDWLMLVSWE